MNPLSTDREVEWCDQSRPGIDEGSCVDSSVMTFAESPSRGLAKLIPVMDFPLPDFLPCTYQLYPPRSTLHSLLYVAFLCVRVGVEIFNRV